MPGPVSDSYDPEGIRLKPETGDMVLCCGHLSDGLHGTHFFKVDMSYRPPPDNDLVIAQWVVQCKECCAMLPEHPKPEHFQIEEVRRLGERRARCRLPRTRDELMPRTAPDPVLSLEDDAWFNRSQAELRFAEYDEYAESTDRQPHETQAAWEDRLILTGDPTLIVFAKRRRELLKEENEGRGKPDGEETTMTARTAEHPAVAALEDPGHVVRCVILDAMKMHFKYHTTEAETIYITPAMEALLDAHTRREGIIGGIRDQTPHKLLGVPCVLDASSFKLE